MRFNGTSVVLSAEFITWFPFTEAAALSIEAESVGVKRAETLWIENKLEKYIKLKNYTKIFNSLLNHPPPWGLYVIFGFAYNFILA